MYNYSRDTSSNKGQTSEDNLFLLRHHHHHYQHYRQFHLQSLYYTGCSKKYPLLKFELPNIVSIFELQPWDMIKV